ncbi:MAG: 50S ribosomal protein L10 [Candidatus Pacebacteria bacterium]|jgi:large subunit ribosomal protein L10|nr:50S ribosomal protein L10 [Candidatus Paceibacterota bacterium]MDP7367575.1 50S ribosomal protein L10 [Candidatus Paceibacterota bacterium]MDP7648365.1 50S ribosomal protein L10 [Candidatus Paceibacterota bacterium]|tara:strand:- start:5 stop:496 length:492 start_codon:yes stop_codon:yes gene_type:complete
MALTKDKKGEILKKLNDIFGNSESAVFVSFKGLKVADTAEMRDALRAEDVGYFVAKKTLIKRVLSEAGLKGEMPELLGETAVAYGTDLTAPARGVQEFANKFKDNIAISGGVFEGRYMDKAEMTEIASIPSLPTLLGKFVNIINSPIQRCAIALNEIAKTKEA